MQPHSSCELKTKGYTEGKLSPSAGTNGGSGGQRLVSIVFAVLVFLISYILVDYLALSCFARIAVDIEGSVSSKVTAYYSTTARHEVFKESQTSSEGQYDAGKRVLLTLHFNNNTVKKLRLDPGIGLEPIKSTPYLLPATSASRSICYRLPQILLLPPGQAR